MTVPLEGGQLPQGRFEGPGLGRILGVGIELILHRGTDAGIALSTTTTTTFAMDEAGTLPVAAQEVAHQGQHEERPGRRGRQGAAAQPLAEGRDDVGREHITAGEAAGKEAEESGPVLGVEVARRDHPVQRGVEVRIFQSVLQHQHEQRMQGEDGRDATDLVGAGAHVGEAEGGRNDGQYGRREVLQRPPEGPVGQRRDLQDGQPRLLQGPAVLGRPLPRRSNGRRGRGLARPFAPAISATGIPLALLLLLTNTTTTSR
mmetsp:Transcript_33002/g.97380  ORF Transcript_33002/g.97380 Transcript_33002/m.97380 type:complete len:259 (-) Transcript_33002:497-1273(-)